MKKLFIVFPVLSLFVLAPFSTALAFGEFDPGGVYNPIHVEVQPTDQYRNQNLEVSLKAQYGSSAYYSCVNRIGACGGDQSDPSRHYSCLRAVQANLEVGLCRSANNTPTQTYTQPTPVYYPIYPVVVTPPAQKGPSCGEGTVLLNNKCVSYSESCRITYGTHTYGDKDYCHCDAGYEWSADNKSCVQPISIHIDNTATSETFGGGAAGGSYTPPQDFGQECKSVFGSHSRLDSVDDVAKTYSCGCESGYQFNDTQNLCVAAPKVVEPESQAASPALLTDWKAPTTTETQPTPRRGFWSWLISLFGF
jgi:hypothetical protein